MLSGEGLQGAMDNIVDLMMPILPEPDPENISEYDEKISLVEKAVNLLMQIPEENRQKKAVMFIILLMLFSN